MKNHWFISWFVQSWTTICVWGISIQ